MNSQQRAEVVGIPWRNISRYTTEEGNSSSGTMPSLLQAVGNNSKWEQQPTEPKGGDKTRRRVAEILKNER